MADDHPRRKSRFDQTEPARPSKQERRSRSPSGTKSEQKRSRSPVDRSSPGSAHANKAAAAAAAAAKINAQIQAQKASGSINYSAAKSPSTPTALKSPSSGDGKTDIYQQDGDFIKDIEVNDLRNRYTLTKGATQKMIKDETGADVTTRGNYYPDKAMATAANPPLYLHITSTSREGLEQAVAKIEDMMKQDLPNLVDERRFRRREPREEVERDELGRRKWPESKIPVDLEPIPGFNLRAQVVGHQGVNVKYIQGETGCRVQIKGRGSGFLERDTNDESNEPMYLHVSSPNADMVQKAGGLCEELLENVRGQYQEFKLKGPTRRAPNDSRGEQSGQPQQRGSYGNNANQGSGYGEPQQGAADGGQQQANDWYTQMAWYAQYYDYFQKQFDETPEQDPFKEQGGFKAAMAYYYQWAQYYQQQQQQQQQEPQDGYQGAQSPAGLDTAQATNQQGLPPPPPPTSGSYMPLQPSENEEPPPPPPPDQGIREPPPAPAPESYNAVPPPPGL